MISNIVLSPDTSWYQGSKIVILSVLPLAKDAIHIYIGVGVFLITLTISYIRTKKLYWYVLLPTFILSLLMEFQDAYDDYTSHSAWRVMDSIKDILNGNLISIVFYSVLKKISGK